jgi:transketolase
MRLAAANELIALAHHRQNIVALEADLKEATMSVCFERAYPQRYIEMGVAEQNMLGVAAGLALSGKIPFVHSFACFISMRACEQVRTTVAYPGLNVKFIATHAGVSAGTAGTTHHATEDIAIMRAIANMTIFVPADAEEARQAVREALKVKGPVYIRLNAGEVDDVYSGDQKFRTGKATILREGRSVAVITTGVMAAEALKAADFLYCEDGLRVKVLHMGSIKPFDNESVIRLSTSVKTIVTLEEHNVIGGLGSAVCSVLGGLGKKIKIYNLGIQDRFCSVGNPSVLARREGITAEALIIFLRSIQHEKRN